MLLKTIATIFRFITLGIYWIFVFTYALMLIYCIRFTVYIYNTYFNYFEGWAKAGVIFLHIIGCMVGYIILFMTFGLIGEIPKRLKKYSFK